MTTKHSLIPWLPLKSNLYNETIDNSNGDIVFDMSGRPELANLIVRAVNAHDDLVAALERILEVNNPRSWEMDCATMRSIAKAALAKATGE